MQFQSFALAIVNDLFDEDLDPDLFLEAVDEESDGLASGECEGELDGARQAQAVRPPYSHALHGTRRLS